MNVGLNLKFDSKGKKVLGYTRKGLKGWEYSEKAAALIRDYCRAFPEFFRKLDKNPKGEMYEDVDFYHPDVADKKMAEMKDWFKNSGLKFVETVSLDTLALTKVCFTIFLKVGRIMSKPLKRVLMR